MENAPQVDPALSKLQSVLSTLRVHAVSAYDLIDTAQAQGAGSIASVLANLGASATSLSGEPATKLELLRQNLREALGAARKAAEVVGITEE